MAAKVCAKRPLCQPPLGVDSPAILNSFFGPMVTDDGPRSEPACQAAPPSLNPPAGPLSRSLGDSLTVEQSALTRLVLVRIQVPQPASSRPSLCTGRLVASDDAAPMSRDAFPH